MRCFICSKPLAWKQLPLLVRRGGQGVRVHLGCAWKAGLKRREATT